MIQQKKQGRLDLWEKFIKLALPSSQTISFTSGRPNISLFNTCHERLKEIITSIVKEKGYIIFDYSPPEGLTELRQEVGNYYAVNPNDVLITVGAQQAIDLTAKTILKPGATVFMENKNYIGFEIPVRNLGVKIKTINNLNKITYKQLENIIRVKKPSLFYLSPDFANPTGETLSLISRNIIIEVCKKYQITILEDQTYRELVYNKREQLPSLKDLDKNVLSIGTVSKTIIPGLRIGWLIANQTIFPRLLEQKRAADLCTPLLNQMIIAKFMKDRKFYNRYLTQTRQYYFKLMNVLQSCLVKYMPKEFTWNRPRGGLFVWVIGPRKFNSKKLFYQAVENWVSFMPGFVFYYSQPEYNNFRLSISGVSLNQVEIGIKRIAETIEGKHILIKHNIWRKLKEVSKYCYFKLKPPSTIMV
jgi:2-aminoadipate transaminase